MTGPFRALWSAPSAVPPPPRRVWRDWVLVGVFVPLPLIEGMLRPELASVALWAVATAAMAPSLLFRRTHPLVTFAAAYLVLGVLSLISGVSGELYSSVYLALLPFSVIRWGSGRAGVVAGAMVGASILVSAWPGRSTLTETVGSVAVTLAIFAVALALRYRATARLRERDRIVLLERESLARDLHDTVAHHVSAIAIRAQAGLATAPKDPLAATDALRVIEAEASRTLAEMRTIVRALRSAGELDFAPSPTLADLARLATDQGVKVEVTTRGDTEHFNPAIAAALFRIAQEAVTNAQRHSRGASGVSVDVEVEVDRVRLLVRDDGAESPPPTPGFGLTGMAERAALLGGTLAAGPHPDGGWLVTADLPKSVRPA